MSPLWGSSHWPKEMQICIIGSDHQNIIVWSHLKGHWRALPSAEIAVNYSESFDLCPYSSNDVVSSICIFTLPNSLKVESSLINISSVQQVAVSCFFNCHKHLKYIDSEVWLVHFSSLTIWKSLISFREKLSPNCTLIW